MTIKITRRDVLWSYVGYLLTYGIHVVMLPAVLKALSPGELGLWYTFLAINQFVMLLDFGFMPTILRNASYCWSGATCLTREGLAIEAAPATSRPNYRLLADLLTASWRIYGFIGLLALGILLSGGWLYIRSVSQGLPTNWIDSAWLVFTVGVGINIAYGYWPALLRGIGAVAESNRVLVISRGTQLAVTLIGLALGGKIMAVAGGFLACGLSARLISGRFFWAYAGLRQHMKPHLDSPSTGQVQEVQSIIWHNAWRQGLVSVGNGLIQRSGLLVCSSFMGLTLAASYGLVQQLIAMMTACSAILFNAYLPVMNGASLRGDLKTAQRYFSRGLAVGWVMMAGGTVGLVFGGPVVLRLWGSATPLLSPLQCAVMGILAIFELTHLLSFAFLTTRNRIPSPLSFLATGGLMLSMCLILAQHTAWKAWGLIAAYGVSQALYNNWRWPLEALQVCALRPGEFIRLGLGQLLIYLRRFHRAPDTGALRP